MTEADWWAATDPAPIIEWLFFEKFAAEQKSRSFAIACCLRVEHLVQDEVMIQLLRAMEAVAVARGDVTEVARLSGICTERIGNRPNLAPVGCAWDAVEAILSATMYLDPQARREVLYRDREYYDRIAPGPYPLVAAECASFSLAGALMDDAQLAERQAQVRLLHDVFGPLPFREVAVEPGWLTSDVTALARGIYADKAFDRLPILADALQDAGCACDDILDHCRRPDWEHVRGCWVVDLLLGKPWRDPPPA